MQPRAELAEPAGAGLQDLADDMPRRGTAGAGRQRRLLHPASLSLLKQLCAIVVSVVAAPGLAEAARLGGPPGAWAGLAARPAPPRRSELSYRVLSVSRCDGLPGMAMTSCNASLRMQGRTTVVFDVDVFVDRPTPTISKLVVNQTRCKDIVSHSTCREWEGVTFTKGVCTLLGAPLMPWSALVDSMQPPLKCPLKKGFYSGRGITIDMRVAKAAIQPGDDVGALKVGRGAIYDLNNAPYMCFEVTTDLVRIPVRN